MMKFLPNVSCGYVNVYKPYERYSSLTKLSFQLDRHIETSSKPVIATDDIEIPTLQPLKIQYPKPTSFFLQGYAVSKAIIGVTLFTTLLSLGLVGWKCTNVRAALFKK
jgi:hypothetical protein